MKFMSVASLPKGSENSGFLGAGRRRGAADSIASRHAASKNVVSALFASKKQVIAPTVPVAASSSLAPLAARAKTAAPVLPRALPASSSKQEFPQKEEDEGEISIVFLKHDLRVDDHAGLVRVLASSASHLLPLYVLDGAALPETCPGLCGAAALSGALGSLRAALRVRGSDLVVVRARDGETAADAVARAAKVLKASSVVAESEVTPQWRQQVERVREALLSGAGEGDGAKPKEKKEKEKRRTEVVEWSAGLHGDGASAKEGDWRKHARSRGPRLAPIDAPGALPPLPKAAALAAALGIEGVGTIPSAEEILAIVAAASPSSSSSSSPSFNGGVLPYGSPQSSIDVASARVYSGGESTARAALAAYVAGGTLFNSSSSAGPAAASAATPELASAVAAAAEEADVPGAEGSSFAALFAPSLALGTLSARRVAADAASALSRLPPLPAVSVPKGSTRARAALAAAEASDFHRSVALSRAGTGAKGGGELRHWRWRGVLTEYVFIRPEPGTVSKGNLLLIHGFGAFGEHYRGASAALARMGYTVYAPTLPGYGRSEKPAARYGQGLWGSFVSEFASCVVKGPVVAAGNSIGGYIVAAAAASSGPDLFKGVILLNPAGRVDGIATGQETGGGAPVQQQQQQGEEAEAASQPPPKIFVEAVSRALFLYLELSISKTLKRLYPSNPGAADEWLAAEIGRAARDPGALAVFQSVFYMPKPRALDVLLVKEFGGPVLLLQGAKDPLNDAVARARALGAAVPGIEVRLLEEAGHCPHDEAPEEVAAAVAVFAARCFEGNMGSPPRSSSSSSSSAADAGPVVSRPAALV